MASIRLRADRARTPRRSSPLRFALTAAIACGALAAAAAQGDAAAPKPARPSPIVCEGDYQFHVQGVATDGKSIFWSFTTVLVKTGLDGKPWRCRGLDSSARRSRRTGRAGASAPNSFRRRK